MFRIMAFLVWLLPLPRFDIARTAEGAYNTRYTLVPRFVARLFGLDGIYLHHFQQSDPTEDFHNHPYGKSWSFILAGGYCEERLLWNLTRLGMLLKPGVLRCVAAPFISYDVLPGQTNRIEADTYHRIDLLDARGCWTLFVAGKKMQKWGFLNRRTGEFREWSGRKPTELYEEGLR